MKLTWPRLLLTVPLLLALGSQSRADTRDYRGHPGAVTESTN